MPDPEVRDLAERLIADEVVVVHEGRLLRAVIDAITRAGIIVRREDDGREIMYTAEGLRLVPRHESGMEGQ